MLSTQKPDIRAVELQIRSSVTSVMTRVSFKPTFKSSCALVGLAPPLAEVRIRWSRVMLTDTRRAQSPARSSRCGITKVMDFLFFFFFLFPVMRAGCRRHYWVYFERRVTGHPICFQIVLKAVITMQSLSQHALHQKNERSRDKEEF